MGNRLRLPAQFLLTLVLGVGLPFLGYFALGAIGWDVSGIAYWVVMAALLVTAGAIWLEGFYALDPQRPPDEPGAPHPGATAVIAAYLPNEAATIVDTVEAFQRVDYPGPFQILVAYNTPHPMAVEDELREMARRDPRILPLKVENSTSKAQNVNAAMSHVTGEFVGMFDADHHPEPGAFKRAWRWLSNGYDVVQGHCVIRNGDASLVARTVAVEFESIYAVSHPGRAALHGFGALRRLQRLLAHQPAGRDPDARLDADRGHRLHPAGARRRREDRLRPGPDLLRARPDQRDVAVEAACPLGPGLVPGLPQAPAADHRLAAPEPSGRRAGWRSCWAGARSTPGCRCRCSPCSPTPPTGTAGSPS